LAPLQKVLIRNGIFETKNYYICVAIKFTIMSSADIFYGLGDLFYWLFINTLEPLGDMPWILIMWAGFIAFGYWMYRQVQYNKQAAADPNQIK
jgi:cytochrome b subunit of formate dehydrogenase